jgi:hypothetical protein
MKKIITVIALVTANALHASNYDKQFVGARLLYKQYDANPIAADAKYRYKTMTIAGVISDIDRDILGNPYIILRGDEYGFQGVQCTFSTEHEEVIATLKKGQTIAIIGEIKGTFLINIMVDDCQFTEMPVRVEKAVAAK